MSDPGAPSGAVAEITTTVGTGPYQLNPTPPNALAAYFRFADVYPAGGAITIEVDDTAQKEIVTGIFDTATNTISRDQVLYSSNGNALVNWPVTGQRTVRPLSKLPICDTPPTVGQVLAWNGTEWCPATINTPAIVPPVATVCPTPPTDGQVLVWSAAENAYCPADLCALVAACMVTVTCLPFIVYSNRLVVPSYAGPLYTLRRSSDNATMTFSPAAGDAPSAAITTFLGGSTGNATLWNDQSGNGYDAIEDTGFVAFPEPPIWLDAQANGHPALQFGRYGVPHAGLDSGYGNEGGLIAHGITFPTASWTVFVVAKHDDYHLASSYPNIPEVVSFLGINAGSGDSPALNFFELRTNPQPYPGGPPTDQVVSAEAHDADFSNGNGFDAQATFDPTAGYVVYEFSWSSNPTLDLTLDIAKYSGADYGIIEDNSYGGDFSVSGDMGVGGRSGTSTPTQAWVGWITEIQLFNCVLTSAERDAVRSNISAYYGI